MKIATALPYASRFVDAARQVVELDKAGLDIIYVAEAYGNDGVSAMGYLAAKTENVQIASGILPIYTRTPTLLAMTAAGMDDVSDGRFILGLGASGPQVIEGFHGVPYDAPLGRTREIVEICRTVWKREAPLDHQGKYYTMPLPADQGTGLGKALKIITHPVRNAIPIHIAALGPKNVEMTAEIADGWLPILFVPEMMGKAFGDSLEAGKAKRDESLGPLDIVAGGALCVGDNVDAVLDFARPMVALYVGGMGARGKNFYNSLIQRYGYEDAAAEIQDLYLDGKKNEAAAAVPRELLEKMNFVGTEGFVKERVQAFKEAGVTVLNVTPVGSPEDQVRLIGQLKEWAA